MQQIPSKPAPGNPAGSAATIRSLAVPQVAPPYDDEARAALAGPHDSGNAGFLVPAATAPPGPRPQQGDPGLPVAAQSADPAASREDPGGRGRPDPRGGAGAWPARFAQVLAETLAGSRPQRQLASWTTEQARRQIRQIGPLFATGERPLVRRVMTATPASGVLELTAVVGLGSRVRVLALRLEREPTGRAWCCTAIESA
jgi:hypothetical protein